MGESIEFFAGPNDDRALFDQVRSLGLRVVPMMWERRNENLEDPRVYPACFLSFHPVEELHPHGTKKVITDATDPVIEFTRSVHEPPHLIAGRVYWSDDVERFGRETKGYFRQVSRWIRKTWSKRRDGYYMGPDAEALINSGAIVAYARPGTPIRQVEIP